MATPEELAAQSANYLNADYPAAKNQPTWGWWAPGYTVPNITIIGVDGKPYNYIPGDYVEKGKVENGHQIYSRQFLDPDTFKIASELTLPENMLPAGI